MKLVRYALAASLALAAMPAFAQSAGHWTLGVGVHNPHQWNVDFNVEQTAELARLTDPRGLLNPGKLNPDYAGARKGAIR